MGDVFLFFRRRFDFFNEIFLFFISSGIVLAGLGTYLYVTMPDSVELIDFSSKINKNIDFLNRYENYYNEKKLLLKRTNNAGYTGDHIFDRYKEWEYQRNFWIDKDIEQKKNLPPEIYNYTNLIITASVIILGVGFIGYKVNDHFFNPKTLLELS